MRDEQLTIGELASRTGVAGSALRYWEDLGLLPAAPRVSGQRRYPLSAVGLVGTILVLRDVGFTLREIKGLIASRSLAGDGWRESHQHKLAELDRRIAQAQAARTAVAHALACPHENVFECPTSPAWSRRAWRAPRSVRLIRIDVPTPAQPGPVIEPVDLVGNRDHLGCKAPLSGGVSAGGPNIAVAGGDDAGHG